MKKFKITRILRYTEEVEVEAESEAEAWAATQNDDFCRNQDDTIVDEKIKEMRS